MSNIGAKHFLLSARIDEDEIESFKNYPYNLPAIKTLTTKLVFHKAVTFIVGENGSGKSTFLEALAVSQGYNPEGGTKNFNFATRSSHSSLEEQLIVSKSANQPQTGYFLRAESFFTVATEIDRLGVVDSYGGVSLHEQSHGESFFALMENRFGNNGLYILDEPEAALSPKRQMAMLTLLHRLINNGCQFIIATHSPILLAYPDAKIMEIQESGLKEVVYEETETFIIAKHFLNKYESMLDILLKD